MGWCFFEGVIFLVCRYPFKLPDSTGRSDDFEATGRSDLGDRLAGTGKASKCSHLAGFRGFWGDCILKKAGTATTAPQVWLVIYSGYIMIWVTLSSGLGEALILSLDS